MIIHKLDTFGGHRDCVYTLEGSASPSAFFSAGADGMVVRWQLDRPDLGDLIARVPASVYALALDPATGWLWIGQNFEGLHVIDPESKRERRSLKLTAAAIFDIKIYKQTAFVALADGVVAVLDTDLLAVRKYLKASTQSARCISINPVEREFCVGYSDHSVRVFDLVTLDLKQTIQGHTNSVFTAVYSPDFRYLVTGGRDAHLKVWDVEARYALSIDVAAHLFAINNVTYSPDGKRLASASMDKAIKIWDADTFRLLKVVDRARHAGHGTSVNKLWWSSYQNRLISASDDRTLSVWEVTE